MIPAPHARPNGAGKTELRADTYFGGLPAGFSG
jgi:hypothetical protein